MKNFPDHFVIEQMERYGDLLQKNDRELDEDAAYEERRERELFGDE
jgi:hypothetical protein